MRTHSEYHLNCSCGEHIITTKETGECPKCHKLFEIIWRDTKKA